MTIEELAKQKANTAHDLTLVKYYEAGIPQWHLESILTMLKPKKLSLLQEFILKFVASGIKDIDEIRTYLGVNTSTINNAIATLQKDSLISVDIFKSQIKMTDKGEKALKEAATIVPEDVEYPIFVDGLLGNVYLGDRKLYKSSELRTFDIKPINTIIEKPGLNSLVFEDVKRAVVLFKKTHAYEQDRLEGDLQEISCINKAYVEYKKVNVLVFMNKEGDIELQVYDGSTINESYSIELYKQFKRNTSVFDFDIIENNESEDTLLSVLPQEIIDSAKEFSKNDLSLERELSNLTSQLEDITSSYEDDEDDISATEKIRFLEKRIKEMENERKGADRLLFTYDHRPLLIKAIEDADNKIIIVSPWIKSSGLNYDLLTRIEKALQRQVFVIIGYGISKKEDNDPKVIKQLEFLQKKPYGKYLKLIKLSNTHEKVLIKDNSFMVVTSFNWLSFKGDPDKGFRQETGYYTESKEAIKMMKDNLSNRMDINL